MEKRRSVFVFNAHSARGVIARACNRLKASGGGWVADDNIETKDDASGSDISVAQHCGRYDFTKKLTLRNCPRVAVRDGT